MAKRKKRNCPQLRMASIRFDMGDVKLSEMIFQIEQKMRELLKGWKAFEVKEVSVTEAKKDFADNPY